MKQKIISEDASYTFSDYFKLNFDVEDIITYFGYTFQIKNCNLPQAKFDSERISSLKTRLEEGLPYVSLTTETARREFLIAPILWEVVRYSQAKLKVEYPVYVNEQLKGTLDYYLQAKSNLLVIEAKNADPGRGFVQLAVELIAIDQWLESDVSVLYGAVSMGDIWRFGFLNRQKKLITQDFNLYSVPTNLEPLLKTLVALLTL